MNTDELKTLSAIAEDYRRARDAMDLLSRVYSEIDQYHGDEISRELRRDIHNFYGLDDSE